MYADINLVKPGNVLKAHRGVITIVNVFNVTVCPVNGYYRGSISDGDKMSNKVMFSPKISRKVLDELVGDGKVTTIKLEIVEIIKDVIIGVIEFTVIEEGPRHVGDASFVIFL